MNPTKKSFLTSMVALVLCFTMFLGTTFAWFTDVVTSAGNIIQSGSLKIDLELLDKESGKWNSIKESKSPLFDYDKWEPGYVDVKVLKVENEGTLALKWKAMFVSDKQLSALADVIDVYVLPFGVGDGADAKYPADRNLDGYTKVGTLKDFVNTIESTTYGNLKAGESAYLGIALKMQDEAGNEYQELSLGKFNIQIVATQMANESDSFGNDYDANAEWPKLENGYAASTAIDAGNLMHGALTSELTIGGNNGVGAVLPADVKVAEGATSLELTMKKVDNDGNLNLGEGENATSFDVHIAGIATDNEKPMRVDLGAVLEAGLGETELKLYHIENGTPVQMTRVETVSDFAIHNQYTYDSATGNVSIYVKSFSVFSAVNTYADTWDGTSATGFESGNGTADNPYLIKTAEQFAYFRDQVDAGNTFKGQFVKLDVDIDFNRAPFDPIGFGYWYEKNVVDGVDKNTVFMGTFDGGNHTIYNLYQNCWLLDSAENNYSTYTYSTAGGGLFASIKNATIKNLAISGAEIVFECVDMGIVVGYAQGVCHFENIVVTNSKIANYNRYTGGVVGEVSYGPYGTDTSNGYSHTFKNITVDSTVTVSGLWGSFGCGMGGVIGGKWGDATVKMENVVSAPVMDVYNDVVSAYQWYAFRGCGMLIGHTEEPYSDGRHSGNATASFLTCENVKVYYGDWVNYHYYEFKNQDSPTGKSYPWVRAEKGEYCDAFSNIRYGVPTHNGVKVSDLTKEELENIATNYTPIVFDQLYGADRGMYGTANHEGVTTNSKDYKIIYVDNNAGWTNLKLQYWFANGDETWTTVVDGIDMSTMLVEGNVYKIQLPEAYAFKIVADGVESDEFILGNLEHNAHVSINAPCTHTSTTTVKENEVASSCTEKGSYDNVTKCADCGEVLSRETVTVDKLGHTAGAAATCTTAQTCTVCSAVIAKALGHAEVVDAAVAATCTTAGKTEGKHCSRCNEVLVKQESVAATGHKYDNACDTTCNTCGATRTVGDHKWNNSTFTCSVCGKKAETKTIYFQNNWLWSDVKIYYWYSLDGKEVNNSWPGTAMVRVDNDGTHDYYSLEIPVYVEYIKVNGIKNDNSGNRDETGNILLSSIEDGSLLCMDSSKTNRVIVLNYAEHVAAHKVFYLDLTHDKGKEWKNDGARFAAYVWKSGSDGVWYNMSDIDGDGIYSCWVPTSGNYNNIIFCRMNGSTSANNWDNKWNQTTDQTPGSYNCLQITKPWDGKATGNWSKK